MSFKVRNCTVAYLRVLTTDPIIGEPDILQLAVKIGNVLHLNWIRPTKEKLMGTTAAENGLILNNNYLKLNGSVIRTKRMNYALYDMYRLMKIQKPILLVTYSSQTAIELFYEAIRKINYVAHFGHLIEGVVNVLPIFQKRYPDLYRKGEVDLSILAQNVLKRDCSMGYFDALRHLELLEELVSGSELRFELNRNRKSWEEFFPATRQIGDDFLKEIYGANEKNEARPKEDVPFEIQTAGGLDPESGGSLVEEEVPVQQFRDRQNLYKQLLINQNRRPNTSDSFVAQQQQTIRKNRRRNNDVAFGIESGDLNPQFGSLVGEQGPQFPDRQSSDEQLLINQDRRRITSDSFPTKQQAIPSKIRRPNNYVAFTREPEVLNTESGLLVGEQGPQFPDWQNSDDQLLTNQDQNDKYDRFSALLAEDIPQGFHQLIGEYGAQRDDDYPFQRQPEDHNAGIGQFVEKRVLFPLLPYLPNSVNLPPVNQNQQGRDWIRDWSQEYNDFSRENDPFFQ